MSIHKWLAGFVGVALVFGGAGQLKGAIVQWSIGDGGNGHWYEAVYQPTGTNWDVARADASNKGGYLASVASEGENNFVSGVVADPKFWTNAGYLDGRLYGPFLGGTYVGTYSSGNWQWVTGEPWSYWNWAVGEPNNLPVGIGDPGEIYLQFFYKTSDHSSATWNNSYGPYQPYSLGYVVEYNNNPVPEPATLVLWSGLGAMGLVMAWRRRKRAA